VLVAQIEEHYTQIAYSWNINKSMFVSSGEILAMHESQFPPKQNGILIARACLYESFALLK
jgi:hypothetical protein